MIYTVTFNPSIDYMIEVDEFSKGKVNRTKKEYVIPGGKGVNVSMVLSNLGHNNTAFGFVAGFTGDEIVRSLEDRGICCDFIKVNNGISRINVKLRSKEETEINGQGPNIDALAIAELYKKLDMLQRGDILVLAGSIPSVMPSTIYMEIMEHLDNKGILFVVDATKDLLQNVLKYHPFLIKPNNYELGELFQVEIKTKEEAIEYANKLRELGARNVLVSMAKEGAVLVCEDGTSYKCRAPEGKVVNSVGAGDSMVAGFLAGYLETSNYKSALIKGLCTGSASAFSKDLATKEQVEALMEKKEALFE